MLRRRRKKKKRMQTPAMTFEEEEEEIKIVTKEGRRNGCQIANWPAFSIYKQL